MLRPYKLPENLFASDLHCHGLAFAFAALGEPSGEALGEAFGSEVETGFDLAISDRKRVVKVGGVGEVAHAELIEPIERAGAAFAANYHVDMEFLCVHEAPRSEGKARHKQFMTERAFRHAIG